MVKAGEMAWIGTCSATTCLNNHFLQITGATIRDRYLDFRHKKNGCQFFGGTSEVFMVPLLETLIQMKKILIPFIFLISYNMYGQKPGLDVFIRLPQVANYNITEGAASFTPMVSAGLTLRYRGFFADVGSFIDKADQFGHYTYFGSPLHTRSYPDNKLFILNWLGELTYVPDQENNESLVIKTVGVSPVLAFKVGKSTFAAAFTLGVAFADATTNLNSRIIINYSLPLLSSL